MPYGGTILLQTSNFSIDIVLEWRALKRMSNTAGTVDVDIHDCDVSLLD